MTFTALESSTASSRPVELYTIELGGQQFHYTSAEDIVVVGFVQYDPIPISRGVIRQGPEDRESQLEIEVPLNNEFASKYLQIVPGSRAKLTIARAQRGDFPTNEFVTIFIGYVHAVTYSGRTAKIRALPTASAKSRPIPRFKYQGLCNHVLYDDQCRVDENDAAFRLSSAVVTDVSGEVITVTGASGFADGFFTAGEAVATAGSGDARLILDHVGDVVTLLLPFGPDVLSVGDPIDLLAGCDHSLATCKSKFDNVINYGGFAFVPTKNIFKTGLN